MPNKKQSKEVKANETKLQRSYASEITPKDAGKTVFLEGWAADTRALGKINFLVLRDISGEIQVTAIKGTASDKIFNLIKEIQKESVVSVKGKVVESRQAPGGREIVPEEIIVLNPSEAVLPIDISNYSKTEMPKRLDWRFLDTRRTSISPIFKIRSKIMRNIVDFFDSNKFININTPKITKLGLESGAELFQLMYFGKSAYLAQSPQLYKQMFVVGGFERVYEIGTVFRAEKSNTTRHLTEFTGIDFEMGFIKDENDVMDTVEKMLKYVIENVKKECENELKILKVELKIPKKIPRIDIRDARKILAAKGKKLPEDEDLDADAEKIMGDYALEKYGEEFVFITNYPFKKRPFYHMKPDNDKKGTRSFDLLWKGVEVATGAQREHRFNILEKQAKEKGVKLDPIYAEIFKFGCPPHGGVGFGLDRLTQRMLNLENIREALLLTRDPERLTP